MITKEIQELILNGVVLINDAYNNKYRPTTLTYALNDKMGAILLGGKEFNTAIDIPIRGTELTNINDILTDIEGIPLEYELFPNQPICPLVKSTYQVHKGGYDRYKLIADDQFFKTLIEIMKSTSVDTVNLYGHSMGNTT